MVSNGADDYFVVVNCSKTCGCHQDFAEVVKGVVVYRCGETAKVSSVSFEDSSLKGGLNRAIARRA